MFSRDLAKVDHCSEITNAFRQFSPDRNFTIPIGEVIETLEYLGMRESEIKAFQIECATDENRLVREDFLKMITHFEAKNKTEN